MRYAPTLLAFLTLSCGTPNTLTDPNRPSDPEHPTDPATSLSEGLTNGSRLRHRYLAGADGTVAAPTSASALLQVYSGGLYDTQLDVACTFDLAEDGQIRCLPIAFETQTFLDSGCTQRAFQVDGVSMQLSAMLKSNPFKYGSVSGNSPIRQIYSVTEVNPTPSALYRGTSASCSAQAVASGAKVYSFGARIPPDTFVAGTYMN